jgi:hypothetical protein
MRDFGGDAAHASPRVRRRACSDQSVACSDNKSTVVQLLLFLRKRCAKTLIYTVYTLQIPLISTSVPKRAAPLGIAALQLPLHLLRPLFAASSRYLKLDIDRAIPYPGLRIAVMRLDTAAAPVYIF